MKAIWLVLGMGLAVALRGRPAGPSPKPPFRAAPGAFFALSVSDKSASVRWYSEKLGLETVMEVPKRDGAAVTVLEGGGLVVELLEQNGAVPLKKISPDASGAQCVHGIFKAGLFVDDLDGTVSQLKARGVEIAAGPFPARGGQRANVLVKDNAGNLIQFFGK